MGTTDGSLRLAALTFIAAAAFYTICASAVPFYNKGEPREALVVRAILNGQSLLLPLREGRDVPSKPPFFHWLAALALGAGARPEELAIRLPSVLAAAGCLAITAALACRWYGATAAILAATMLGSSYEWLRAAIQARVDMTLTFLVMLAGLTWSAGLGRRSASWTMRAAYLVAAAATLTKGPVGIVLGLLIAASAGVAARDTRRLSQLLDPAGIALWLAICGTWYALAWHHGGDVFVARHFFHENIQRFLGTGSAASHRQPFFYYAISLPLGAFPWTLVIPAALWQAWRGRTRHERFLLAWITAIVAFYSLAAGKRSVYVLPVFPPLALLAGRHLSRAFARPPGTCERALLYASLGAAIAAAACVAGGVESRIIAALEPIISHRDLERLSVTRTVLAAHRAPIAAVLTAIAGALASLVARRATGPRRAAAAVCAVAVLWASGLIALGTQPAARALTQRPFAKRVQAVVDEQDLLSSLGYVPYSFRYYVGLAVRPWRERMGPSSRREFLVAPARGDAGRNARRALATRFVALSPHTQPLLGLYELRSHSRPRSSRLDPPPARRLANAD